MCCARFGLPRCAQGRARDVAQAAILDRAFAEAIDSVLADRRQPAALASRVVGLMNALARQEPRSLVGGDGAVVDVLEGGRTFKSWRAAGVLLLAFSVCSGVALGFQSLGLESACLSAMLSVFAACAWTVMDRYGVLGDPYGGGARSTRSVRAVRQRKTVPTFASCPHLTLSGPRAASLWRTASRTRGHCRPKAATKTSPRSCAGTSTPPRPHSKSADSPQDTRKRPSGPNARTGKCLVRATRAAPPQVRIGRQAFRFNV